MNSVSKLNRRSERQMRTFVYMNSQGEVGVQKLRQKRIEHPFTGVHLVQEIRAILNGSEAVTAKCGGYEFTLAPLSGRMGEHFFAFCLVVEGPSVSDYAVFYMKENGETWWIAGPKRQTFGKVWMEFLASLGRVN